MYVETSVIGAYFDERTDVVSSAQRYWIRLWWDEVRSRYEVVISRAVMDELSYPDFPHSQEALELVSGLQEVPIEEEVKQIVRSYIQNRVMPANPVGDALHLALASYHKCDYLLTTQQTVRVTTRRTCCAFVLNHLAACSGAAHLQRYKL